MTAAPERPDCRELACDYCGLPVPAPRLHGTPSCLDQPPEPLYCCFGCRFAAAVTRSKGEEGSATWALTRLGLAIFLTMNVMAFTMALWSHDVYGPEATADAFSATVRGLFRYLSMLFALPVLWLLGVPLFENAWDSLRQGRLNTDLLLVSGVVASYVYSAVSVLRDSGAVYFEVGCMVLIFVTLGRWLEATGKIRTTAALESLHRLLPDQARLVAPDGERSVPLAAVAAGDTLRVLPGERIPCDGTLARGTAAVDEQVLTGESSPALKEPGGRVLGGTLNLDGDLHVRVTAPAAGGALARMIDLVRHARQAKGRYEHLADRISAWFLPVVVVLALLTLAWHGWFHGPGQGLLAALAVLLIACPCALGLATPMAVWAALGQAARAQVLFRTGEALERLARVRAVRIDKTGTLTTGTPEVVALAATDQDLPAVTATALALANASTHAHCLAIRQYLSYSPLPGFAGRGAGGEGFYGCGRQPPHPQPLSPAAGARGEEQVVITDMRSLSGRGLTARRVSDGETVLLGSPRWLEQSGLAATGPVADAIRQAQQDGHAMTALGWDSRIVALVALREQLRPEAAEAVRRLREQGLQVEVLTGDHAARGRALGRELGLPVQAELLPEDKVAAVRDAHDRYGPVAMVGDGINDAPALAAAEVGIALGCGADVSRDSASVCLLGNDLLHLSWAVDLSRRTVRVIRGNLFWAFFYNVIGVAIACTGRLNPVLASLAMVVSSLLVVTNSLRLASTDAAPTDAASADPADALAAPSVAAAAPAPRPQEPVT